MVSPALGLYIFHDSLIGPVNISVWAKARGFRIRRKAINRIRILYNIFHRLRIILRIMDVCKGKPGRNRTLPGFRF